MVLGLVLESLEHRDPELPLRGNYSCSEKHSCNERKAQVNPVRVRQNHLAHRKSSPVPKGITALLGECREERKPKLMRE